MRALLGAAALVCVVAAAGCATSSQAEPGEELVGCYQFQRDEGARALNLPWGFELLGEALDVGLEGARLAVSRLSAQVQADYPFRYWVVLEDGTVRVGYPGRGAYRLDLQWNGRDLVGNGWDVGDVVRPGEPASRSPHPVIARRVICPAPVGR